jgi:hypothetical protein
MFWPDIVDSSPSRIVDSSSGRRWVGEARPNNLGGVTPGVLTRAKPGAHGGAGCGAKISPGGAGRGAQAWAPVRPCPPCWLRRTGVPRPRGNRKRQLGRRTVGLGGISPPTHTLSSSQWPRDGAVGPHARRAADRRAPPRRGTAAALSAAASLPQAGVGISAPTLCASPASPTENAPTKKRWWPLDRHWYSPSSAGAATRLRWYHWHALRSFGCITLMFSTRFGRQGAVRVGGLHV